MNDLIQSWRGGLIVSCQAPARSPLAKPEIIGALARVAAENGAVGVRIDSPENIRAVRANAEIPVLGIYKIVSGASEVYITPTFSAAFEIARAGSDVIALDATERPRPNNEKLAEIVLKIKAETGLPVMADVATFREAANAIEQAGVDLVSTTLSGYTAETRHLTRPDFALVEEISRNFQIPTICEGRLRTPADVKRAFDCGAFAVVVGNAITGVDSLVREFAAAAPRANLNNRR